VTCRNSFCRMITKTSFFRETLCTYTIHNLRAE
jgi:hypothetical protein